MSVTNKEAILPVSILIEGPLKSDNVRLVPTSQKILFPQEALEYIDLAWREEAIRRQGGVLIDSQHVSFIKIDRDGENIDIITGQTSFKERLATTSQNYIRQFGADLVAKTIGVDALIQTADQKILVGQRNTYRSGKTGGLHIAGGMIEQGESLMTSLKREIAEETGLKGHELENISLLGITQNKEALTVDVIYLCFTQLESTDIVGRQTDGELGVRFISNTPVTMRETLLSLLRTASTPSIASLYLYGKQNFGLEWADLVLGRIARRKKVYSLFGAPQKDAHMQKLAERLSRM